MSDPVDDVSGAAQSAATQPAAPPGRARMRVLMIAAWVLLALAIAAAWIDLRNGQRATRLEVAKRFAAIETSEQGDRALQKETQESLREAQAKITLLENRLGESQTQ
jgi:uncharacterized protein HemX